MIHNLTDYTLTEEEFSVLTKGLSFVPTPIKTFKQEINKSWSKFKILMLKQYSFRNGIHEKLPPFKRESSWKPPPSDKHILISFFTCVEQELGYISTARRKIYNNLTLKEKTAFNNLKN